MATSIQGNTTNSPEPVSLDTENGVSVPPRRPIPAIKNFAVLTAFVLPIGLLPYLVTRRQLAVLRTQLEELKGVTDAVQHNTKGVWSETVRVRGEDRSTRAALHSMKREIEDLRSVMEERYNARLSTDNIVRSDLQKLLNESQNARQQAIMLRSLGTSLADIAAFMHEVELEQGLKNQGKDQRGVERLRQLALRMQNIPPNK